jgi:hypothetical protein
MREAWIFPREEKRESIPPILRHNSTITTTNLPKIHHQPPLFHPFIELRRKNQTPINRATMKKSNREREKIKQTTLPNPFISNLNK